MNIPFQMWVNKLDVVYLPNLILTFAHKSQGEGVRGGEQNDVRYFSKGVFPRGNFSKVQFPKRQLT